MYELEIKTMTTWGTRYLRDYKD